MIRMIRTLLFLSFYVNGLKLSPGAVEPTEEKSIDLIPVGRPFDFEDDHLDNVAEMILGMRSVIHTLVGKTPEIAFGMSNATSSTSGRSCTQGHHFMGEEDCKIFDSEEVCQTIRRKERATFLDTYPGSGNTWMRVMLEDSLSIYTGSVFRDPKLIRSGMLGERSRDTAQCTVIKTLARCWHSAS
eukprot:gnl/MRDRNA2_/MRDRNA2_75121_c0_seq1.p1 gnl/MRDRNA2_/MRDRNA2_75121_c0~~gnl/MRDRNA2_/MRDRNA2_75121_c0_seq1.p1  ORF type:complete len:185 (+),score=25.85 gnl/MRDRNA2_/MRDRNA2_75121_c0_seq1:91-645(+)